MKVKDILKLDELDPIRVAYFAKKAAASAVGCLKAFSHGKFSVRFPLDGSGKHIQSSALTPVVLAIVKTFGEDVAMDIDLTTMMDSKGNSYAVTHKDGKFEASVVNNAKKLQSEYDAMIASIQTKEALLSNPETKKEDK